MVDIKAIYEKLRKNDAVADKVSMLGTDMISIRFHKYLHIRFDDDMLEYLDMHRHPYDSEEVLDFVDDLINERIFFYRNRLLCRNKQYDGVWLDRVLKTKNKRYRRVFSAIQIYIDK
jgi:hypothetical protein